jgi:hypothetical protein
MPIQDSRNARAWFWLVLTLAGVTVLTIGTVVALYGEDLIVWIAGHTPR